MITNKYGLPGALVEAIKADDYDPGESDITVTQLIAPPQIRKLREAHGNEIEEDASDRMWALMGKAVHQILEDAEPSAIVEERLYMDALGWKLGGKFDRMTLRQATLQDYKFCSVWEHIHGLKPDRIAQLNVLAELAIRNGYKNIRRLEIVAIYRDWSIGKAKQGGDYPKKQTERVPVPLWGADERMAYINERIRLHQLDTPPHCSDEDRWARPTKYAVMKEGRKSAVRVYEDLPAAEKHAAEDSKLSIEVRPGEKIRCASYCDVSPFCQQWQAEQPTLKGYDPSSSEEKAA